jgi:hypothetical protein
MVILLCMKMIDIWLLYSFNIIVLSMGFHTLMDRYVHRDPVDWRQYTVLHFYQMEALYHTLPKSIGGTIPYFT